ncbi:hypothetical protein CALVIDRAFT_392315 [Calocera viscosa TUFC12733]|uniref:Uncharacterized protein n=1 Tax=Calocera viscosa (strain TUFC12733) TaxID=1330018 RepID=A0A167GFR1_CALVF|nr:hypothetical protein CALVIDRAFT_392315 [Calocera viscosa TUFC12733]
MPLDPDRRRPHAPRPSSRTQPPCAPASCFLISRSYCHTECGRRYALRLRYPVHMPVDAIARPIAPRHLSGSPCSRSRAPAARDTCRRARSPLSKKKNRTIVGDHITGPGSVSRSRGGWPALARCAVGLYRCRPHVVRSIKACTSLSPTTDFTNSLTTELSQQLFPMCELHLVTEVYPCDASADVTRPVQCVTAAHEHAWCPSSQWENRTRLGPMRREKVEKHPGCRECAAAGSTPKERGKKA